MTESFSTPDTSFRRVLEQFKATLSQDDREDFGLSTLDDLKLEILAIQEKQASEKKMKNSARLKSFLEAMEQYDEVVKVFLNTADILAFVWVASTFADAFDALLDAYQDIGENIPLLAQYESLFKDNPHMYTVLELIYADILEFHRKALGYFKQRMWRQLFHATWKTFRTKFSGILANLRRHKTLVESQANLIQFAEIQKTRAAAEAQVRSMQRAEVEHMQIVVRSWLSPASSDVDQENVAKVRADCPDTGRWLFRQSQIRSWCDPDSSLIPLLWLNGIPGAGKTVLTSLLIDECRKVSDVYVAFFYCKHRDPQRSTFVAIARSILLQLLRHKKALLSYIYKEASTSGESSLESSELTKKLLEVALKAFDKVYLIIDGLDECGKTEKKLISTWFQSIVNSTSTEDSGSLRCLFVSQADNDTGSLLNTIPTLQITSMHNREDITNYCAVWARKIQEKFELSPVDTESIVATVSSRADGEVSIWKLVMAFPNISDRHVSLCKAGHEQPLQSKFKNQIAQGDGSRTVSTRIRRGVKAKPSDREDAARLLGWLVCARRPLKWHEIQGAWSFDSDAQTFDYEERRLRTDSKELCGSLVEIRHGGVVDLVHLTAKLCVAHLTFQTATEEFNLTCLCLGYLNLPCFETGIPDTHIRKVVIQGHYAFMDYAVAHWFEHLERCVQGPQLDSQSFGILAGILRVFLSKHHSHIEGRPSTSKAISEAFQRFKTEDFFRELISVVNCTGGRTTANDKEWGQTHSLDLVGQIARVRSIIEEMTERSDPVQKRKLHTLYGPNAFKCSKTSCKYFYGGFVSGQERDRHIEKHQRAYYCTYPGCHIALVGYGSEKDLKKHEAEYHQEIEDGSTFPWYQAPASINICQEIRLSNLAAVETWMEQFKDNIPLEDSKGPLVAAIKCRNERILNMLLNRAPDYLLSNPTGNYRGDTCTNFFIRTAIESQNEEAVRTLLGLAKGITHNSLYSLVNTALSKGEDALAMELMGHPNSGLKGSSNRRKLMTTRASSYVTLAIRHARIAVVRSLSLDHGVQLDHEDSKSRTALMAAAEFGQEEIMKFLLETGKCNTSAITKKGETAALIAAKQGHEKMIRLLFPQEPLPREANSLLRSAELRNAARAGDAERVRALLKQKGVVPDLVDRGGYTPLLLAAENGHDSVVKQLLERPDVQINRRSIYKGGVRYGRTALHLAVYNGHEPIVRRLLSRKGVDVKAATYFPGHNYETALEVATARGNEAIIKLLEEHTPTFVPWSTAYPPMQLPEQNVSAQRSGVVENVSFYVRAQYKVLIRHYAGSRCRL
ncbi:hypothetical protein GP486_002801 [Trichoglossum hirsutum]|uniref:NACHT domain-containing protein n=1 Tax=Trichoglossum hirsutum TaxID=265104 RepID=A0A9P8LEI4_9PEZI|nr:hypothetical protein GP486_002801 [Trichoglossum hirsutum]